MSAEASNRPGSFSDGVIIPKHVEKREQKWRKSLITARERVIVNAESKGNITPQYSQLLRAIHTSTFDSEAACLLKVKTALALRSKLQEQKVGEKLTANIGSGTDWQFPVALGARNIIMIDPDFNRPSLVDELLQSIRQFDPNLTIDEVNKQFITFETDIGNGMEKVTLHLDTSYIEDYKSQSPIGFSVECSGPSKNSNRSALPIHPHFIDSICEGTLILPIGYPHEISFNDELGLEDIGIGKYHLYRVKDLNAVTTAAREIIKIEDPQLNLLQKTHKARMK